MNRKVGLTVLSHQHWLVLVWLPKDKQTNLLALLLIGHSLRPAYCRDVGKVGF